MQYCTFGSGNKNLVIIPGLSIKPVSSLLDHLEKMLACFCDEYTVYLFDRRTNLPESYSVQQMAEDTVTIIKSLGIESADFYGASQGGMIVQCIAAFYPEIVGKIALASTVCRKNQTAVNTIHTWLDYAQNKDVDGLIMNMIETIYSENTLKKYKSVFLATSKNITADELPRFITLSESCLSFDIYDSLDKIKCPAYVFGCYGDKVLSHEGTLEIAEKLSCQYYLYGNEYGHGVYVEAPDFIGRLHDFMIN